jgi:hypothetical protein
MTFEALPASSHLSIDVYSKASSLHKLGLCAYSDASFADAEDCESTLGYLFKLYGNNEPSIQLVNAKGHHKRMKHVNVYYYYIKDHVKEGYLSLQHVRTHDMAADGLTKPLDKHAHRRFLDQVSVRKPIIHSAITNVPVQD